MHSQRGFTLIEVLIVVSIMSLLTGFLIVYTRGSENQIKILKDKAAFFGALYRARSLSLRTIQTIPPECGYGVYVLNERQYVVWRDTATKADCSDANKMYDSGAENFESVITLSSSLKFDNFGAGDFMRSVLFIPPDPTLVTDPEIVAGGNLKAIISTLDRSSSSEVRINRYGQIEAGVGY
jgi:prepilin-type N-terminal cleavage/methylation domain-containing protein